MFSNKMGYPSTRYNRTHDAIFYDITDVTSVPVCDYLSSP